MTAWAFVRSTNNPRVRQRFSTSTRWLNHRGVRIVHPGPAHLEPLAFLAGAAQGRGSETTGAILAALAMEQGATLAATDQGFRRFPGLKWLNPAAG